MLGIHILSKLLNSECKDPKSYSPQPINTSQSPVTDGGKGQQGLAGSGRGLTKVRPGPRGVWDCCDMACLSVSMQVDE